MRKTNCFLLTGALLCSAATATALEVTANNDIRHLNSGLEQRLETTKSALTAVVNSLKEALDDILARLEAVETDLSVIKYNGANDEVQRWNPKLEARLDNIEATNAAQTNAINTVHAANSHQDNRLTALEARPLGGKPTLVARPSIAAGKGSTSVGPYGYDLCVLSSMTMSTTEDNHGHTCDVSGSPGGYVLSRTGTKANTACAMTCFNF